MPIDVCILATYFHISSQKSRNKMEEEFQNEELSIKKLWSYTKTLFDHVFIPRLKNQFMYYI